MKYWAGYILAFALIMGVSVLLTYLALLLFGFESWKGALGLNLFLFALILLSKLYGRTKGPS